jgi:hypothetical protein
MKNDAIFRVQEMNTHLPFAVVGSNEFVKVGNKNLRARQYPWGVVQVRLRERSGREVQFLYARGLLIVCQCLKRSGTASGKPDPRQSGKHDADPHQSEKGLEALEGHFRALEGSNVEKRKC